MHDHTELIQYRSFERIASSSAISCHNTDEVAATEIEIHELGMNRSAWPISCCYASILPLAMQG